MTLRLALGLFAGLAMLGVAACGGDDDGNGDSTGSGQPPASQPDYCDELDQVRSDVDDLQSAVSSLNRDAAQNAVTNLRSSANDFRDEVRSGGGNDALNQAAGDLSGAVEGLETTLRQATQGGITPAGVIQELETQLPVIVTSLNEIRTEARCD